MSTITLRANGSADPAVAWERYARPSLWSSWSPQIRDVDVPVDRIAPGLRGTVHGPLGVRATFLVTAVDEDSRTWSWRAGVGPVRLDLHHEIGGRPGGCSTRLVVSGPLPIVLGYLAPARLALTRLVGA